MECKTPWRALIILLFQLTLIILKVASVPNNIYTPGLKKNVEWVYFGSRSFNKN